MTDYIPPALDWVREQVELYEISGGTKGTTLLDTGLPCIIVTHMGNKSGATRKIPLMRVKVDEGYVLVGSMGGQPKNPVWVYNLRANPDVEIRDATEVTKMRAQGGHRRSGTSAFVGRQCRSLPTVQRLSGQDVSNNTGVYCRTGVRADQSG